MTLIVVVCRLRLDPTSRVSLCTRPLKAAPGQSVLSLGACVDGPVFVSLLTVLTVPCVPRLSVLLVLQKLVTRRLTLVVCLLAVLSWKPVTAETLRIGEGFCTDGRTVCLTVIVLKAVLGAPDRRQWPI